MHKPTSCGNSQEATFSIFNLVITPLGVHQDSSCCTPSNLFVWAIKVVLEGNFNCPANQPIELSPTMAQCI